VLFVLMTILGNRDAAAESALALSLPRGRRSAREKTIRRAAGEFFDALPKGSTPGPLDAMRLLDDMALSAIRFPAPLFLFRKMLFTLDGVLGDIAGSEVRIDRVLATQYLTRWLASFGLFHAPLKARDLLSLEWRALLYPARSWLRTPSAASGGAAAPDAGRKPRRPAKSRPAPARH
jgi:ubiquinone biosynthesis protein